MPGMTVAEILADDALRHHEFPVTRDKIFLAHAGVCPLPRRVAEAIAQYASQCATSDQELPIYAATLANGRALAARLLQCQPGEIALVGPTSLALSLIAGSL